MISTRDFLEITFKTRFPKEGNIESFLSAIERVGRFGDIERNKLLLFLVTKLDLLESELLSLKKDTVIDLDTLGGVDTGHTTTSSSEAVKIDSVKPKAVPKKTTKKKG